MASQSAIATESYEVEAVEGPPMSTVLSEMKCPICLGVPVLPIWLCIAGHVVCNQCRTELRECGLCRGPFTGGRNLFMESLVRASVLTCPYKERGCLELLKGDNLKDHLESCRFGPQIKWIKNHHSNGALPTNAVEGGYTQNGIKLYVIRASHEGSITPGKLCGSPTSMRSMPASLSWGGGEHFKTSYEILVASPTSVKWRASSLGEFVPNAIPGGLSETGETIYIGRAIVEDTVICGKVHPSHQVCYIALQGMEKAFEEYEILVQETSVVPEVTDMIPAIDE